MRKQCQRCGKKIYKGSGNHINGFCLSCYEQILKEQNTPDDELARFLYFERMYSYDDLARYFKHKYTYLELRHMVQERFKENG